MLWIKHRLAFAILLLLVVVVPLVTFGLPRGVAGDLEADHDFGRPKLTRTRKYRNLQDFAPDGFSEQTTTTTASHQNKGALQQVTRRGVAFQTMLLTIPWKSVGITVGGALWMTGLCVLLSEWFHQVVLQRDYKSVVPKKWLGVLNRFYVLTVGAMTGEALYLHSLTYPYTAKLLRQIGVVFAGGGVVGSLVGGFRGWWALLPGVLHTLIAIANMSP
mmetsp:Transcript_1204/g.2367  ORF Transcript_1204/g.2367 Transcript_1204/m.2367 type:complete len:217 (-) Transcript_1204:119-769(-)|eukprot:scaffold5479_cov199-Amphora_coffeaeformis.AAC.61